MSNPENNVNEVLERRVHQLENELQRMRKIGAGAIAAVVVFIIVAHLLQRKEVRTGELVANSVVLRDADGHDRARLAVFPEGSGLDLYAPSGERRVQLVGGGEGATLNLNIPIDASKSGAAAVNLLHNNVVLSSLHSDENGAELELHSKVANGSAILGLEGTTASLSLSGADEKVPKIWLSADRNRACTTVGGVQDAAAGGSLCLNSPGQPSLELSDSGGNRAVVGIPQSADLNAEGDSAASLILKHKSGSKLKVKPR